MIHIDLFAGLGGNSLAFDTIFHETKNTHIFCEIEPYCQAILHKHWPGSIIHGDIRTFASNAGGVGHIHGKSKELPTKGSHKAQRQSAPSLKPPFILTGGFPCQPFSQAGRRKGTEDDRHLWPAMLGVIQHTKPTWIIAENVRGLLTIGGGLVFETVCTDLERAGYEVQPFIIPAVAVNAPHRRDRIWFVAHNTGERLADRRSGQMGRQKPKPESERQDGDDADTGSSGLEGRRSAGSRHGGFSHRASSDERTGWHQDWHEVAASLCRMDDGVSALLDGVILSASAHRKARLKALGNAIVPQVAMEIMQAIKQSL